MKDRQQNVSRRAFLRSSVALGAGFVLSSCIPKDSNSPSASPLPEGPKAIRQPPYNCFADAYKELGEGAMPKTLDYKLGNFGEKIYDIPLGNNKRVPVRVYSLGNSFAPGEHFPEMLQETGFGKEIKFKNGSVVYNDLQFLDIWVFNKDFGNTVDEARELFQKFPITYEFDGNRYPVDPLVPKKDDKSTWDKVLAVAQKAKDSSLSVAGICKQHSTQMWNRAIEQTTVIRDTHQLLRPAQFYHYTESAWKPGQWAGIIRISMDSENTYVGTDHYYSKVDLINGRYTVATASSMRTIYHELAHALKGTNEYATELWAQARIAEYAERVKKGDFRADLVPVDKDNNVLRNNLP